MKYVVVFTQGKTGMTYFLQGLAVEFLMLVMKEFSAAQIWT